MDSNQIVHAQTRVGREAQPTGFRVGEKRNEETRVSRAVQNVEIDGEKWSGAVAGQVIPDGLGGKCKRATART